MATRVKSLTNPLDATILSQTEVVDSTQEQREVTVDGYTFHFGPNEVKNFLDESVGQRAAAFRTDGVIEDAIPYGSSRS